MKKECVSCGKNIIVVKYRCSCGLPLCNNCRNVRCRDCIVNDRAMIRDDYNYDKYHGLRNVMFSMMIIFFLVFLSHTSLAYTKSDFLTHTNTYADITNAYTQYRVCNPTTEDIIIDQSVGRKFLVDFNLNRGYLNDYHLEVYKNVDVYHTVYDYGLVEKSFRCYDSFTYTTDPKHATCYKEHVNGTTEILFDGDFTHVNLQDKIVYHDEYEMIGSHEEAISTPTWKKFTPIGSNFKAGTCYDIRVVGNYKANSIIDNIISFADYSYPEYAWWNNTWSNKREFNITDNSGYDHYKGMKINFTGISISTTCQQEIRILNSTEDGTYNAQYVAGDNSTWCYMAFTPYIYANTNTTFYVYYNNPTAPSPTYSGGLDLSGNSGTSNTRITFTDLPDRWIDITRGVPSAFHNGSINMSFIGASSWYAIRDDEKTAFGTDLTTGTGGTCSVPINTSVYSLITCTNGSRSTDIEVYEHDYRVYQTLSGFSSTANDGIRIGAKLHHGSIKWRESETPTYVVDNATQNNLGVSPLGLQSTYIRNQSYEGYYLAWVGFGVNRTRQYIRVNTDDPQILYFGHPTTWEVSAGQFSDPLGRLVWGYSGTTDAVLEKEYQTFLNIPSYIVGDEVALILPTRTVSGFYDESYADVVSVGAGEEFFFYVNYSYADNSSSTYPDGYCLFSADEVITENYTIGVNTSIYGAINYSKNISGLPTDNYINDIVRVKLCRGTGNFDAYVHADCPGNTPMTIPYSDMPLCSSGQAAFSMNVSCPGQSYVDVYVWSDASGGTPTRLVDGFVGVDRVHNVSSYNMSYDVSREVFLSPAYEVYDSGTETFYHDCYSTLGGVENKTGLSDVLVIDNVAPVVLIDSVWYWLLSSPVSFVPGMTMYYPLVSSINVSGVCTDFNDVDLEVMIDLYFDNSSLIDSTNFTSPFPESINYSSAYFSTETSYLTGTSGYSLNVTCCDPHGLCDYKSGVFDVINTVPVGSWVDTSPISITSGNHTFNYTCTDYEGEILTSYVFVDGVLNTSGVGLTGFLFDHPEGSYNLTLVCEDSFFNSTDNTLLVTYSQSCDVVVTGLSHQDRFRDLSVPFGVSCNNAVNLTSCSYSINDYAAESFVCNQTNNMTLEVGRNKIVFYLSDGITPVEYSLDVYGKKLETSGIGLYVMLFILLVIIVLAFIVFLRFGVFMFGFVVVLGLAFLGIYILAFSLWLAFFVWIFGLFLFIMLAINYKD